MVRFVRMTAAVVLPLVASVRVARKRHGDVKKMEGVPIYNYEERLRQNEQGSGSGVQGDLNVFDWTLMLNGDQSDETINKLCAEENACKSSGHQEGVPFIAWRGTEEALQSLIKQHKGEIEYVEPDFKIDVPEPMPVDDVQPANMWNLDRVGVGQSRLSGKGVHIYVFDTGVHVTHSDFGGRARAAIDTMQTGRVIDCSTGGGSLCAHDTHGHGTHCAGTAAGTQYGVAKQARIYAAKVCCGSNSNIMAGLDWVGQNGKKPGLVTMSLGGSSPGTSLSAERAVNSAVNRGIAVVVASGNSNADTCTYRYGFVSSAISVGSTDAGNLRSGFSNYGSCNDIYAPGSRILSAKTGGGSTTMSGTSMACPAVAGGAAMYLEKNPTASPANIKRDLKRAAKKGVLSNLKSGDPNELLWVGSF